MMPGTTFVQIRRVMGVTQQQLAYLLNMSMSTIHKWESGTQKIPPSVEMLLTLWAEHPRLRPEKP